MSDKKIPTIEELSASMEAQYHQHHAEITALTRMITALARKSGVDPVEFAKEVANSEANLAFGEAYNEWVPTDKKSETD